VGMKQLQPHPWDAAAEKYKAGERVRGAVTRVMEFGAFVELEPGIEGLIHVTEMSWAKKVRRADDVVKPGETVEAVVLAVNAGERRISLGLKQALGDPWADVAHKFPVGSAVEGPVTSLTKFGAFVQISEGVEGMVHVSEITDKRGAQTQTHALAEHPRIHHPQDVLKVGQIVKAQVIEVDKAKRQVKLSMKQLVPSSLDEYMAEHKEGDLVTGRLIDDSSEHARVELGEGVQGTCRITAPVAPKEVKPAAAPAADLSSLSAMLNARWKGDAGSTGSRGTSTPQAAGASQIRSFRIIKLDPATRKIQLELA